EMKVPAHRPEVRLVFDELGAESPREHMTGPAVPPCPPDGVTGAEPLQAARAIGLGGTEEHLEVVGHQDEGDEFPAADGSGAFQRVPPVLSVAVVPDEILAALATGHAMRDGPGRRDAQPAWQDPDSSGDGATWVRAWRGAPVTPESRYRR